LQELQSKYQKLAQYKRAAVPAALPAQRIERAFSGTDASQALMALEDGGLFVDCNDAMARLLQSSRDDILGVRRLSCVMSGARSNLDRVLERMAPALLTDGMVEMYDVVVSAAGAVSDGVAIMYFDTVPPSSDGCAGRYRLPKFAHFIAINLRALEPARRPSLRPRFRAICSAKIVEDIGSDEQSRVSDDRWMSLSDLVASPLSSASAVDSVAMGGYAGQSVPSYADVLDAPMLHDSLANQLVTGSFDGAASAYLLSARLDDPSACMARLPALIHSAPSSLPESNDLTALLSAAASVSDVLIGSASQNYGQQTVPSLSYWPSEPLITAERAAVPASFNESGSMPAASYDDLNSTSYAVFGSNSGSESVAAHMAWWCSPELMPPLPMGTPLISEPEAFADPDSTVPVVDHLDDRTKE